MGLLDASWDKGLHQEVILPGQSARAPVRPFQPSFRPAAASPRRVSHGTGFWMAAYAFAVIMAFSAVPTPLYVIYGRQDHFSGLMSTLIYAVYAVGVIASLFFLGHVSDWVGRRRVLIPAVGVSIVAGLVFIFWTSIPALLVARILSGVAVGMVTSTATAHLGELHAQHRPQHPPRRSQLVAVAANLGGIGLGPLISGLLAQFAPRPLLVPYLVFEGLLLLGVLALSLSPETAAIPAEPVTYRPQRLAVPPEARGRFAAAATGGLVTFAVFGVFNSLAPAFLAGTLHDSSHALAGAVAFAVFAAAAIAQIVLMRLDVRATLTVGIVLLPVGLGVLSGATWVGSLPLFVAGGVIAGAGAGLSFKGALTTAVGIAPPGARAEVLAGYFLASYIGLSVPIVILGLVGEYVTTRSEMAVFSAVVTAALIPTTVALLAGRKAPPSRAAG
jgi:MFS family permease